MWTKPSRNVKCPRGDCCYYDAPDDSPQCGNCTCNYRNGGMCRTFNYTSRSIEKAKKKPSPQKQGDGVGHSDSGTS